MVYTSEFALSQAKCLALGPVLMFLVSLALLMKISLTTAGKNLNHVPVSNAVVTCV